MIKEIFIPKLGMTMEKATVSEWLVQDGEQVTEDQAVLVIETEKAAEEIVSPLSGRIAILVKPGEEYPCGTTIAVIAETNEEYLSAKKQHSGQVASAPDSQVTADVAEHQKSASSQSSLQVSTRVRISPLARKLVQAHDVDINDVTGTGPLGRIVKRDVLSAVEAQQREIPVANVIVAQTAAVLPKVNVSEVSSAVPATLFDGKRVKRSIPLTGMRKIISGRMHQSTAITARVSSMCEVDMTEMIKLRDHYVGKAESLGVKVSFTDLFLYIASKALRKVPIINSSLAGDEIKVWEDINIGLAVSVAKDAGDFGLVVPVIHNVESKGLVEIARLRKELTEKARAGTLTINDVSGGTFTITNTAALFPFWHIQTPIINHPEVAILGTSSTVERAVVREGQIVVRPIMPISFSFDHRVMDGAPSAEFLRAFVEMAEDPRMILA
jgi:pyruvate dehydrogenase E2 component (dihydrolipoamide acetyltransferase)